MTTTTDQLETELETRLQAIRDGLPAEDWARAVHGMHKRGELREVFQMGANLGFTNHDIRRKLILGMRSPESEVAAMIESRIDLALTPAVLAELAARGITETAARVKLRDRAARGLNAAFPDVA